MIAEPEIGSTFAGYRIEERVGRGGMGIVYRATDSRLERPVALKLIAPELAEDRHFRERFLRESRLAASLDHPGVVPIYEAGEEAGRLFIAMRYVEGSDLRTVLEREGLLPPDRVLAVLRQVASALDAAHAGGLVHRDVKPGNILIDREGHAYLTDFGLTRQLSDASTQTGQLVGTLAYLAPEQIRGDPVDARTDCYALACVLYQCLAGEPPFQGHTEAEMLWAHLQGKPSVLGAYPALEPVLDRALGKEMEQRYESCSELIEVAGRALGGVSAQQASHDVAPPVSVGAPRKPASKLRRGRPLVVAGVLFVAGAIAAAAVLTVWAVGDEGSPPTVAPNSLVRIDPASLKPSAVIQVGSEPDLVVAAHDYVWVLNDGDRTVSRIDTGTNEAMTVGGGLAPCGMAADPSGDLWVASCTGKSITPKTTILRLDAVSGKVEDSIRVKATRVGIFRTLAYGRGSVWIGNPDPDSAAPQSVTRIEVRTKRRQSCSVGRLPAAMAFGEGALWVANLRDPSVSRVWPSGQVETIRFLGSEPASIAVSRDVVWVGDFQQSRLWRFDPREFVHDGDAVIPVRSPSGIVGVAAGAGRVWATAPEDGTLWQVDPQTNRATRIRLGYRPVGVAVESGSVWVAVDDRD